MLETAGHGWPFFLLSFFKFPSFKTFLVPSFCSSLSNYCFFPPALSAWVEIDTYVSIVEPPGCTSTLDEAGMERGIQHKMGKMLQCKQRVY